jgi:hypothetical protein
MLKEQLVGFLSTLTDILYCLRTYRLPKRFTFPKLGDMRLKFAAIQMLSPPPVIPFVERNAMVIDRPSSFN